MSVFLEFLTATKNVPIYQDRLNAVVIQDMFLVQMEGHVKVRRYKNWPSYY